MLHSRSLSSRSVRIDVYIRHNISWKSQLKYKFPEKSHDENHLSSLYISLFRNPIITKIRPKPVDIYGLVT